MADRYWEAARGFACPFASGKAIETVVTGSFESPGWDTLGFGDASIGSASSRSTAFPDGNFWAFADGEVEPGGAIGLESGIAALASFNGATCGLLKPAGFLMNFASSEAASGTKCFDL